MQMEEAKEHADPADIISTLNNMQLVESQYLIEKIVTMAINQSFQAAQKEATIKELESQLKQVIENNSVQEQLLFHVVQQTNEHLSGFIELNAIDEPEHYRSNSSSRSTSPVDSISSFSHENSALGKPRRKKARNIAATTEQLLYSSEPQVEVVSPSKGRNTAENMPLQLTSSVVNRYANGDLGNKSLSYVVLPAVEKEPRINTYSQLLPSTEVSTPLSCIKPCIEDVGMHNPYLVCSHIVEGHSQSVLCVECTDDVFFTGSQDGSVKIWDLSSGTEIQTFSDHPSGVIKVCYCEYTRSAFSASSSVVRIWDVRQNPATCIQSLWSTGQMRSITDPILASEYLINDISLNQYGTLLYSATSRSVQIWDLRMLQGLGALNVGYRSNVLSLAVTDVEFEKNLIVCGSEDKSIKIFEIYEDNSGVHEPKYNLSPPHYDGVQALAIYGNSLLSGSRDMSIRKWDLNSKIVERTQHKAHGDWVCSLNILNGGNKFLSGCRSGTMKVWSMDKCNALTELKAHKSSINSIASNNSLVFTASSDHTARIWKLKLDNYSGFNILR